MVGDGGEEVVDAEVVGEMVGSDDNEEVCGVWDDGLEHSRKTAATAEAG